MTMATYDTVLPKLFAVSLITLIVYGMYITFRVKQPTKITKDGITLEGLQLQADTEGMYNQLKDVSYIAQHDEKGMIVWQEFLIYATLFGISKKVLKQIRELKPEVLAKMQETNPSLGNFAVNDALYLSSFTDSINHAKAFGAGASFASGGFSGGFGGGRRRRWWPEPGGR